MAWAGALTFERLEVAAARGRHEPVGGGPSSRRPKPDVTPGRIFFRKRLIYFLIGRGGGLCYYRLGGLRREGERVRQRRTWVGPRAAVQGRRERCKTAGYVGCTSKKATLERKCPGASSSKHARIVQRAAQDDTARGSI